MGLQVPYARGGGEARLARLLLLITIPSVRLPSVNWKGASCTLVTTSCGLPGHHIGHTRTATASQTFSPASVGRGRDTGKLPHPSHED